MATTVLLFAQVQSQNIEQMKALLNKYLPGTRRANGIIDIKIYQDHTNPEKFVFYENWESIQDYENYIAMRKEQGVMNEITSLLISPPKIEYYNFLPEL